MSNYPTYTLSHQEARKNAVKGVLNAPDGHVVTVKPPTRTLDQNAKLWPMLRDIAKHMKTKGIDLEVDQWKFLFARKMPGRILVEFEGESVTLPARTSNLKTDAFSDLLMTVQAYGDEQGVPWTGPALKGFEEMGIR